MKVVEIFKTNLSNRQKAKKIIKSILMLYATYKVNFDLEVEDNILRVESSRSGINIIEIINCVINLGYSCQP